MNNRKLIDFEDVPYELNAEAQAVVLKALAVSQLSISPRFVHLCGIPGSGKTTYAQSFSRENPGFALVQFDEVMESLTGYQQDRKINGLAEAFKLWELPARAIGYQLLQALLEARRDVLFDHSASNRMHIVLIERVKALGYSVEMHYLECSPPVAVQRVRSRQTIIQRHTPERLIWERHELLQELIPLYRKVVDDFVCIESKTAQRKASSFVAGLLPSRF